ncbi:hypothetical protein LshimejAT787_0211780 [Lyophyllum shimeji]|uniref:Uncharacterized protein n=1 Tax=Lyophyllum shimeji TaxID=47721 RepID=A0A9P3PHL8_LYOSH|nr:hypothetical protein LshimejAT787_0211780 [Lyophyllum shimeji]
MCDGVGRSWTRGSPSYSIENNQRDRCSQQGGAGLRRVAGQCHAYDDGYQDGLCDGEDAEGKVTAESSAPQQHHSSRVQKTWRSRAKGGGDAEVPRNVICYLLSVILHPAVQFLNKGAPGSIPTYKQAERLTKE